MANFVGFKSPRRSAKHAANTNASSAELVSVGSHGDADHTFQLIGGHGGAELSPPIVDGGATNTPTPMLADANTHTHANHNSVSFKRGSSDETNVSISLEVHTNDHQLVGAAPPVPRVFLSYAHAANSFFAKRLLVVSISLALALAFGLGVYYLYKPSSLVLNPQFRHWHGFFLRDPFAVYLLQATACENLVGFSALVFHALPLVVALGLPATGVRVFEPFTRDAAFDAHGHRHKVKRTLVFQLCELLGATTLVFALLVWLFFWYMFFNGAAFACDQVLVDVLALYAMGCYGAIFFEVVALVRYREHIKMQLGAFKESDQTGGVRKHLVDVAAMEFMAKDNQLLAEIRKRLYKATRLGDVREMQTVLALATAKKLDQKGFPMSCYRDAKLYLGLFGVSTKNPMHVAAYNGNIDALELLHEYGFATTTLDKFSRVRFSTGDLLLYFAHVFITRPVVSDEEDAVSIFKTTLVTPLHCAVSTGQLEAVRWLIAHGAEVGTLAQSSYRSERIPPIFLAETPGVVRELLEHGANHLAIPDPGHMNTVTALQLAYLRGNFSVAQELEEWGCDVALTPFHSAAARNDTAAVRKFIRRGTHLDVLGEHGYIGMNRRTPLFWAAVNGALETVELLLEAGAQANFQDARGRTPLHWAARLHRVAIVKSLLSKHAEPNIADMDHMTPIVCAALARNTTRELFSLLVQAGADINYQLPSSGDTALHIAVREENEDAALALLACGGNIMQVNNDGLRPLDCSTDTKLLFAIKQAAGHRDVMISYTHSHAEFAKKLRKSLEDANVTTWLDLMDPSGIGGGAVWREEIARGITHAALVVCILTEDYAQSEWCLKELALAKQVGTPILAVSTEGVPIGEELQVYLYTRQIIPFEPCITTVKRNAVNTRQIEYEYEDHKYKSQFRLLLDGVRDEIEKRRHETITKTRATLARGATANLSIISTGFSTMFQPWDAPGTQFVFVSHGDRHASFVHRLCEELASKEIAFYGDRNIDGQTFDERIHQAKDAILKCTCFVVILSKETMRSELVRDQLAFAEDKGRPIYPIVLNDVQIGFDKRYSLARTEFFHFLSDGFAFSASFNQLLAGLKRHYVGQDPASVNSVSLAGGRPRLAPTASSNTSFTSNNSFVSFVHAGGSSSSFVSDDSSDTPYLAEQSSISTGSSRQVLDTGPTTAGADVIDEETEQRASQARSADRVDSIRNLESISSLCSEDREHLELVRM